MKISETWMDLESILSNPKSERPNHLFFICRFGLVFLYLICLVCLSLGGLLFSEEEIEEGGVDLGELGGMWELGGGKRGGTVVTMHCIEQSLFSIRKQKQKEKVFLK